jgi:hypothetical protein
VDDVLVIGVGEVTDNLQNVEEVVSLSPSSLDSPESILNQSSP